MKGAIMDTLPVTISQGATLQQAIDALKLLSRFICTAQLNAIAADMKGGNRQFAYDNTIDVLNTIMAAPPLESTHNYGTYALAYAHYFKGGRDWFLTEIDHSGKYIEAYGLALTDIIVLGNICVSNLIAEKAWLDLNWSVRLLLDIDREGGYQ
jgi:hypothetical protein